MAARARSSRMPLRCENSYARSRQDTISHVPPREGPHEPHETFAAGATVPRMIGHTTSQGATDAELIAESLDRPDMFAGLFDRYSAMLYRYAWRRMGPQIAEDMVGDTFLAAFECRHRYDLERANARPWLFGILTKQMSRHRRREDARYRAFERSPVSEVTDFPADRIASDVTAAGAGPALVRALAGLAAKDRDVLLLIAWADLSYDEVAGALAIPVGTVRSRLSRARRRLREALGHRNPMDAEDHEWTR